jgi:trk system potassium uptake protein TrkH
MEPFEAISHSFSTVAIGGFSTHDASLGYFQNDMIEIIAIIFMLLSGVNFALHFAALRKVSLKPYMFDSEFKAYLLLMLSVGIITVIYLHNSGVFPTWQEAFLSGFFHTVSIGTTTGFTTSEYFNWPGFLPVLLILMSFAGGCAGSTGGGMKVVRMLLLFKQAKRELLRLLHPNAEIRIKMGRKAIPERVIEAVWGFFAAYVGVYIFFLLLLMASGLDQITAFSAVAACLNNLGPGLGDVGANFQNIPDFPKWVLSVAMLMGRLEIFTLLILLTPEFWRR